MIRVAVTGASGRMGQTLVQTIHAASDLTLGAAFEHPEHDLIGRDAGEVAGVGATGVIINGAPSVNTL